MRIEHHRIEVRPDVCLHVQATDPSCTARPKPVLLFVHGFITTGTENHGIFVRAARAANTRGYATVLFDFEGAGYSDGDYEDFRISSAVTDLRAIADWALESLNCDGRVVFFGQSLGSALSLVAQNLNQVSVAALVLWNLSARFEDRYPTLFNLSMSAVANQCVERKSYMVGADFLRDAATVDVLSYADNLTCPTLLLNCTGDSVGDISIAEEASRRALRAIITRLELPAKHSFDCQRALEHAALLMSLDWLDGLVS